MLVNLNDIGRSFVDHNYNIYDVSKPNEKIDQIKTDLIFNIVNNYSKNFTDSEENTIEFLKALLEYCYISNIDINKYIKLSINEKI